MRLAILFHRFGPYHHARLRAAARLGDVIGIEFSQVDQTYQWATVPAPEGFRKITLFDDRDVADVAPSRIAERMDEVLAGVNPSAIAVPGWGSASALIALRWANSRGLSAIAMSETMEADARRSFAIEAVKARILRLFAGAIVGGTHHREYLQRLGMRGERIALGYDCVDNAYFGTAAADVRVKGGDIRLARDLPRDYFLASSRFIEKKNIPGLIRAHSRYCESVGDRAWHLVLLGDGPLRAGFEALATRLGTGRLLLPGFVQYEDLPKYYGLAKAFIHASITEPWGLVVNEAMASGLPVLVSKQSGCAHELVHEGKNGFTFDANDEQHLAGLMARMSSGELDLPALGARSAEIISQWSTERFAIELWRLATAAREDKARTRPNWLDRGLLRMAIGR